MGNNTVNYHNPISRQAIHKRILRLKDIGFIKDTINKEYCHPDHVQLSITLDEIAEKSFSGFKDFISKSTEVLKNIHNKSTDSASKGLRYNTGKPKWSLVDFPSLEPMVRVMEYGAGKYAPHNWKKGMSHTEISECLMRHLVAYLNGEDTDPESGESHVGHIQCNAMFLQYNIKNHPELDDRYKPEVKEITAI